MRMFKFHLPIVPSLYLVLSGPFRTFLSSFFGIQLFVLIKKVFNRCFDFEYVSWRALLCAAGVWRITCTQMDARDATGILPAVLIKARTFTSNSVIN